MIIFIYGPDTFRSSQKLKEIESSYRIKHKDGLNFQTFEWSHTTPDEFKNVLCSASIFDEKKLVIVKNACASAKADQQKLIEILEEKRALLDESIIVVFFEAGKPEKSELFSWLVKKVKMTECFDSLAGTRLLNWAKKEIEKSGSQIQLFVLEKLVSFVGPDLWQMSNEINKLTALRAGKAITEADVDLMVKTKYDSNIFATIDALAARNKNLAYKLMHQHLEQGESELYILTMFVYQFRNLLQIKSLIDEGAQSGTLAQKTGLHPFVIKKSWSQLRNFSLDVLKKIYERLLQFDIAVKRGRIEPGIALDLIVGEIAG